MTMDRHDAIAARLPDYVLGELDVAERRDVDAHLATCPTCAEELRALNTAFHSIGLAEVPAALPPHLKNRVMAGLEAEVRAGSKDPAYQIRRRWSPAALWLAASAAMVVAFGGLLVLSMVRTAQLNDALRQADAVRDELAGQLAQNESQADLAVEILTAGDMRRIDLSAGDAAREALGRAYFSPTKGLLIVADQLPEPPVGRIYQVWLIGSRSSGPVSAGLLQAQRSGRGILIVPAPAGVAGETITVAITDEPPGGLPAPTGAKHLVGS